MYIYVLPFFIHTTVLAAGALVDRSRTCGAIEVTAKFKLKIDRQN